MRVVEKTALEELREVCEERGIPMLRVNKEYKISICFQEYIRAVVIYDNATDEHIQTMADAVSHIFPTKVLDESNIY